MSTEPQPRTSRFGAILVLAVLGASAVGVLGWHLLSNRGGGPLDSSGFDISDTPDAPRRTDPVASTADARTSSGLGMLKSEPGLSVVGPGGQAPSAGAAKPENAKARAALSLKEAAIKNEKVVTAFSRRMEARYPSIKQFGKDWVAAPDLRALRDQYWRDRDPIKFAYGMVKSDNFGKLLKKYAADPGVKAFLVEGVKQAPADLLSAAGQVFQNDYVAKDLVKTVAKNMGLPASLAAFMDGGSAKPPDQNQVLSEIMKSPDVRKALQDRRQP